MYIKFRATYDPNLDTFKVEYLLVPCCLLAFIFNRDINVLEVSEPDKYAACYFLRGLLF